MEGIVPVRDVPSTRSLVSPDSDAMQSGMVPRIPAFLEISNVVNASTSQMLSGIVEVSAFFAIKNRFNEEDDGITGSGPER